MIDVAHFSKTAETRFHKSILTQNDYFGLTQNIEKLCRLLIANYFTKVVPAGQWVQIDTLKQQLVIEPQYDRMVNFLVSTLVELEGAKLAKNAIYIECTAEDPNNILHVINTMHPQFGSYFTLLVEAAHSYQSVLSGQMQPQEVLYANGDTAKLERIYKTMPKLGYEAAALRAARDLIIETANDNSPLSILEIGAGQGILTDVLIPLLGHQINQFIFTDISNALVSMAKAKYKTMANIEFQSLDVESSEQCCALAKKNINVICGFNVIHATKTINESLKNLFNIINHQGSIILVENVKQEYYVDMLYGLFPSWWHFENDLRINSPLLTITQWFKLLDNMSDIQYQIYPLEPAIREITETAVICITLGT